MTATQLPQTKRMITKLNAAGYARNEFSVQTPCNHKGEYQKTETYIRANQDRQEEMLSAVLAQGIDVRKIEFKN